MSSFLRDYEIITQNNEVPKSFHLYASLVALSSIVSSRVWLDLGLFAIRPNLYVVLTGPPGVKKTTAMSVAKRLLRELGEHIPMSAECQTKEALVQTMGESQKICTVGKDEVPQNFKPIDDDNSKFQYSPMSVFVTELSQFVGSQNAGHMLDFLTTIYDEEIFVNSTKGKGTDTLPMPYLTLLACTVPDWITAKLKDDVISGGFSRRAIFVYEQRAVDDKGKPLRIAFPGVSDEMKLAWDRVVAKSKKLLNLKGPFQWAEGARDFYENWYNNLPEPTDPLLEGWFNSVHVQMLKIAMLISASEWEEGKPMLEIVHMTTSIKLLALIEENIPKVFKGVGRNELFGISNKLLELLKADKSGSLPERFVLKTLFREADVQEIAKIIGHLIKTGEIVRVQSKNLTTNQPEIHLKIKK